MGYDEIIARRIDEHLARAQQACAMAILHTESFSNRGEGILQAKQLREAVERLQQAKTLIQSADVRRRWHE